MEQEPNPIADDELLYRRIPVTTGWYDSATGILKPQAFAPHRKNDTTGISVARAKLKSLEDAAQGRPGKSYYVATMNAGELRDSGIDVVSRPHLPDGYDPAHAELPDLNSGNRKTDETLERQQTLVTLCRAIDGPFETPAN